MSSKNVERLIVFSDDWGRHPSSCQHLVRRLLRRYSVLWVNTIGTRPPRLSAHDLLKVVRRLRDWVGGGRRKEGTPEGLSVISPLMWPGFRTAWQRRLNATRISRAVGRALGPRLPGERRIAITTIPIVADLPPIDPAARSPIDVDEWAYYCVDDFSVWPGLDGSVLRDMERQLASRVQRAIAASPNLRDHLAALGLDASLLTHGVDLEHWARAPDAPPRGQDLRKTVGMEEWARPIALFWGLIDRRLDSEICLRLSSSVGTLALVGPTQAPDPQLGKVPNIRFTGPVPYEALPVLAQAADVLVMPYADLPVTRAMQPLKFKEYLATGRPVVARRLPAVEEWADAADLAADAGEFAACVSRLLRAGPTSSQAEARSRLERESWAAKARQFAELLGLLQPAVKD